MNRKYLVMAIAVLAFGYLALQEVGNQPGVTMGVPVIEQISSQTNITKGDYYVTPEGNDTNDGNSFEKSFKTIQKAVDLAQPGNIIILGKGVYNQDFISRRNGTSDNPITIYGTREAVVNGDKEGTRMIEINHDYIILQGFTVDGLQGPSDKKENYKDKLVYVLGIEDRQGVTGLKLIDMEIKNAGGECVRLRYFSQNNEIANNYIHNCGAYDYKFGNGKEGKNGEGIYVGTAPEQTKDGKNKTKERDESNNNWIHNNTIDTQGNECVDVKESSSGNIVEDNKCTGQKDPQSAGIDARGSNNIIRRNEIYGNVGAGVRLGGDKDDDGIDNIVVENVIRNNEGGGIKLEQFPQGELCRNTFEDNGGKENFVGEYTNEEEIRAVLDRCK